jgi:hypothetical protein
MGHQEVNRSGEIAGLRSDIQEFLTNDAERPSRSAPPSRTPIFVEGDPAQVSSAIIELDDTLLLAMDINVPELSDSADTLFELRPVPHAPRSTLYVR